MSLLLVVWKAAARAALWKASLRRASRAIGGAEAIEGWEAGFVARAAADTRADCLSTAERTSEDMLTSNPGRNWCLGEKG